MTSAHIAKALRDRVAAQARHRCGYCLTLEALIGAPLEIDHLLPISLGGLTVEPNLWLACSLCNRYKGNRLVVLDPVTRDLVPLFNPRRQIWREHFTWTESGDRIVGLTRIGRATVVALNLNRLSLVHTRRSWVSVGWHPPKD
jgi:5-methylcytosine-specific restriction endonuclease McrA